MSDDSELLGEHSRPVQLLCDDAEVSKNFLVWCSYVRRIGKF